MSTRYALPCTCGATVPVEVRQAGESVSCQCGKTLDVPKLRDLRRLKPLDEPDAPTSRAPWSILQGVLFVGGLCLLVLSIGSASYVWYHRQRYDISRPDANDFHFQYDMMEIPLTDSWELWKRYSNLNLEQRPTPLHVLAKAKVAYLDRLLRFWGIVGAVGLVLLAAAFAIPAPKAR